MVSNLLKMQAKIFEKLRPEAEENSISPWWWGRSVEMQKNVKNLAILNLVSGRLYHWPLWLNQDSAYVTLVGVLFLEAQWRDIYGRFLAEHEDACRFRLAAFWAESQLCLAASYITENTTGIHWYALLCTVLHCTTLQCTTLYYTVLHCTTLYYTVLHCTILHCTTLHCIALLCTLQSTTLHYTVYTVRQSADWTLYILQSVPEGLGPGYLKPDPGSGSGHCIA